MSERNEKGLLVVVSSPSGGGKNTIIKRILAKGNPRFRYSISMTTRPLRPGEIDGRDYFFVSDETFRSAIINNELFEYEEVHGYLYGTPKSTLQQWIDGGFVVFLDLDVHGALALRKMFASDCLILFLKPPNFDTLVHRLRGRKTESSPELERRLQRVPEEMAMAEQFDYVVINDDLTKTVAEVEQLLDLELRKRK